MAFVRVSSKIVENDPNESNRSMSVSSALIRGFRSRRGLSKGVVKERGKGIQRIVDRTLKIPSCRSWVE